MSLCVSNGQRFSVSSTRFCAAIVAAAALAHPSAAAASITATTLVAADGSGAVTTQAFSTSSPNVLLVVFAAADGPVSGGQTLTIGGAGLAWRLVRRANGQPGTAEIWAATAPAPLSNITISSTQSVGSYHQSITVVGVTDSRGIGASAAASAPTGAPAVSLTTTQPGSMVIGVGNDWDHATARSLGANQLMVHETVDTATGDTYWVQAIASAVPDAGTSIQLTDTAPTTDRWNFAAVEILASSAPITTTVNAPLAPIVFANGSGAVSTPPFSTFGASTILLAFAASDGPPAGQSMTVSGAGLDWTLLRRANTQAGTAEIWTATAPSPLSDATVRSTPSVGGYRQSLTVAFFEGGSRLGASTAASAPRGAPALSIASTLSGSVLYGVGNDWDRAVPRTVGSGQAIVNQWAASDIGDTFWVQANTVPSASAGAALRLDDLAPTRDRWNFAAVEVALRVAPPPVITLTLSPDPNAAGWHNSPVTVHFMCTDAVSGIASCPPDQLITTEGANQRVTGTATNNAGISASVASDPFNIDLGRPAISVSLSPPPNANGWNREPVTAHFTCADTLSGVAVCPPDQVVATDGLNQPIIATAIDIAGNTASKQTTVNIDRAPPVITLSSPADNATVFASPVNATGTVIDPLSGVAGVMCNGAPAALNDGQVSCGFAVTPGQNSLTATVTDLAGNTASTTRSLQYSRVPVVTITAPANLSYLNISPTTVTGTVDAADAEVTINSIPAAVANGTFSIALPLAEGPNVITASAKTPGAVSTASVDVTLDTTPPHVTITSPAQQFVTSDVSVSVAGNINDIVVGTVNDAQAQVTVNGAAAQVANRMFLAADVPLAIGPNVIQAIGRDRVGNAATTEITVTRVPVAIERHIRLASGNNQTGAIGSTLPQPLTVKLSDAIGAPVANTPVIFKVSQNDGLVAAGTEATNSPGPTAVATTDSNGQAQVRWTIGHRAGAGGNGVEAYAVGFEETAVFTASGTQGAAGKIVIDTGNDQIGAVNQPLPKPFIAVVVDDGNNRLGGVQVTFTVVEGGGSFDGVNPVTVETDSDGRAAATLTLGLQEGNANNLVQATFASNAGFPAAFTASGRAPGDPQKTTISGVVLDNSNAPIPGVLVRAVLTNELHSNAAAVPSAVVAPTDAHGQFLIPGAPVGLVKVLVDGSTAQLPGVYPSLEYDIVTVAGQANTIGQPMYLLPLNTENQLCVTATSGGGTLTIPEAPGFSLTFRPGQVTFPGGSKEGCVSVTVVHGDKVPMVPGFGQQPRFIVTIQPAGAVFNPPAPITLPNVDGLRPREVTEMYSFDHDIGSFVAIGTGTVSDDGTVIRSNAGVGVLKAGWHCGGNPSSTGTAAECGECRKCEGQTCVADNSASCDDGKFCTSGDGKNPGTDKCDGGSCKGKEIEGDVKLKAEVDFAKIAAIKENIKKISEIATTATKWMPCWIGSVEPTITASEEKGTFCCEEDKKMLEGNRLSGGGGGTLSAGCFIGLTSIAPELPPSLIAALGLQASAQISITGKVSDVLSSCTGPQWNESGELNVSVTAEAVFVKVGDIVGAKIEGPQGKLKLGFKAENLFSNFHFTGSACLDGEVKFVVEHFGIKLEVLAFNLFDKICLF